MIAGVSGIAPCPTKIVLYFFFVNIVGYGVEQLRRFAFHEVVAHLSFCKYVDLQSSSLCEIWPTETTTTYIASTSGDVIFFGKLCHGPHVCGLQNDQWETEAERLKSLHVNRFMSWNLCFLSLMLRGPLLRALWMFWPALVIAPCNVIFSFRTLNVLIYM